MLGKRLTRADNYHETQRDGVRSLYGDPELKGNSVLIDGIAVGSFRNGSFRRNPGATLTPSKRKQCEDLIKPKHVSFWRVLLKDLGLA
ncbi:hypothetical protein [Ruegeria sp. HKCCA4707]|uniref:hypothetical protein n=1 Tax=Ruegeria sp. HKCCA4707 TaxID=2682984 RepID=UPI00147A5477|nr:hypothetical protein [Ruegeria sp. HKCCA4707]